MVLPASSKDATDEEKIAAAIVPYNRDDDRARYLGLRSSGFKIREALQLLGKAKSTLSHWRLDPDFVQLENRLPEFRKALALEYTGLEFIRNFRLILEKDLRVIQRSLQKDTEGNSVLLSDQEQQYLVKMRNQYTPQQLQVIEALITESGVGEGFDFTGKVLELTRTQTETKTLRVATRERNEPSLGKLNDQ